MMPESLSKPPVSRVHAIVPAAGRSRRMGQPKQLLDVGGRTMLEAVIEPLVTSGCLDGIVVVTHGAIASQIALTAAPHLRVLINDDETSEMIDSIRMGLRALGAADQAAQRDPARARDGFLVLPGDQPGLSPTDIRTCVEAFRGSSGRIVIATWQGRRGHPIVFPRSLAAFVMSEACDQGLRALAQRHEDLVVTAECESPAVLRNINTAMDYEGLQASP